MSKIKCEFLKYCSFRSSCCGDKLEVEVDNDRKQKDVEIELETCCCIYRKVSTVHSSHLAD